MDVGASLVAHAQATEAVEQCQVLRHHPAVAPRAVGGVDAGPNKAWGDSPLAQSSAVGSGAVGSGGNRTRRL